MEALRQDWWRTLHAVTQMKIVVYACNTTTLFFRGLIDACAAAGDNIEWSVICPQGHFVDRVRAVIPPERVCYLYEGFDALYATSGEDQIIQALACGEGLPTALLKDKDGYRHLDKDEQLRRGAAIHLRYIAFLDRVRPDFVLFPDLEVVDGFILMNLCQERGIGVLYYADMRFLGRGFFAPDPYEKLPLYFGDYNEADIDEARQVIDRFRQRRTKTAASSYPPSVPPKPSLYQRLVFTTWLRIRYEHLHASEETWVMRITRNVLGLATTVRRWRFYLTASGFFDRSDLLPEKYVFYALHYTPESSINGLEPYYVDQLRAIDALLLSLPRGHRLVVKEHPAMCGMRQLSFYRQLRKRPGMVLLPPSVDSRMLMERAAITITVTGTVGLEAYLLGKPFVSFGRNFFAHLGRQSPALSELRGCLQDLIVNYRAPSEHEKEIEIAKMLNVGGDFAIGDPWFNPRVMAPANIAAARAHLIKHLARIMHRM
jgi:Capsule polysaccharide biosynthesis protein